MYKKTKKFGKPRPEIRNSSEPGHWGPIATLRSGFAAYWALVRVPVWIVVVASIAMPHVVVNVVDDATTANQRCVVVRDGQIVKIRKCRVYVGRLVIRTTSEEFRGWFGLIV